VAARRTASSLVMFRYLLYEAGGVILVEVISSARIP